MSYYYVIYNSRDTNIRYVIINHIINYNNDDDDDDDDDNDVKGRDVIGQR